MSSGKGDGRENNTVLRSSTTIERKKNARSENFVHWHECEGMVRLRWCLVLRSRFRPPFLREGLRHSFVKKRLCSADAYKRTVVVVG